MFLTNEILEQHEACGIGVKWFQRNFPNGAELIEVIKHKTVTPEFLHWGFSHLTTSATEKEAYWERLNVHCDNMYSIYMSNNVADSKWVSRSTQVANSSYVFSSSEVTESNNVLSSNVVQNSSKVYESDFVFSSKKILHCQNVTDSHDVVYSDYVVNSHSVRNSAAVTNSAYVDGWLPGQTKQIKNCRFIMDCVNLKNCLFCHKVQNGEYLLFNKPIDAEDYENILQQLDRMVNNFESELVKESEWPSNIIPIDTPRIQHNILEQYSGLPTSFWRWVKTLPNYDPAVLYAITYNKELI
jgi:hypothetical protein